jgi:hypothetical protein
MLQFCSSNGKYFTSTAQLLLNMTIESQVTFPSLVTMTFVLIDDQCEAESAL